MSPAVGASPFPGFSAKIGATRRPRNGLYVGDFNGDGKLDLLVPSVDSSSGQASLTDYLGAGNGTFKAGPVVCCKSLHAFQAVALGMVQPAWQPGNTLPGQLGQ